MPQIQFHHHPPLYRAQPHQSSTGTEVSACAGFLSLSAQHCTVFTCKMGPRVLFLLALGLVIFTDHSQGASETNEQTLIVSAFTDGSPVGGLLSTARPVIQRQEKRPCTCKGKGPGTVNKTCHCLNTTGHNGKIGKWKAICKNKKRCQRNKSINPSVPI